MRLEFKQLHPEALLPAYQTPGAAAIDLHAVIPDGVPFVHLFPESAATIRTGLAVQVPEGWVLKIYSRSGHGFKYGVRLSNCVAVIDPDYRGELLVSLRCDGEDRLTVRHGERIAQAMLVPAPRLQPVFVDELPLTARGEAGIGSTGV